MALLPSIAMLAGVHGGIAWAGQPSYASATLVILFAVAVIAWLRTAPRIVIVASTAAYAVAGFGLGAASAREAFTPSIRSVLNDAYGGFTLATLGPAGPHAPVPIRARLLEDAVLRDFGVSLRAEVEAVEIARRWRPVAGGVRVTVLGAAAADHVTIWRAGRTIEAPVTFRRPAPYLNDGVPDFERDLASSGVALNASVKSGVLVQVIAPGHALNEAAADVRAHVRAAVQRRVGSRDPIAGAIVTAILIGDRSALPDEVRDRLQAAGTYHVIAISGGNIAILAAVMAGILLTAGVSGRASALAVICGLAAYALVVCAGPSVWRATATAIVYLAARLLDHRSPPWNAMAVSAALLACVAPLDVCDVGFALTFGATAAILEAARRTPVRAAPASWIVMTVAASLAVEVVLLPIGASAFSRATVAGLALNLLALPLMTVAQLAGLAVVALDFFAWCGTIAGLAAMADGFDRCGEMAGLVAAMASRGLIESARLVDAAPWLTLRVPPPATWLVVAYYLALAATVWLRGARLAGFGRARLAAFALLIACGAAILTGASASLRHDDLDGRLRLTMFDVGQGDAVLMQMPGGRTVMVDAGGAGFDGTTFDIGGRVLAPALWARGIMRLDTLAITHGDPDHIGGALALVRDFAPREIWQGIAVPRHVPSQALASAGRASGASLRQRLAGWTATDDGVAIRVLHPPAPDWERPRVRNDDSLVVEVRFGEVAILLTGDIGADVEREILDKLSPAPVRILKVAHHGSRTSTSQALLDAWRPHLALVSCGRGNRFGHPAPIVIQRLEAAGARIYRTDRDGQITLETDGREFWVRTYLGGMP